MLKLVTVLAVLALLVVAAPQEPQQEPQKPAEAEPEPEFIIPPEEKARKNPVEPTTSSINLGRQTYRTQCAMCHGEGGNGKGDLAEVMELELLDYRDPKSLAAFTDGELFYILKKGKGKMPGQEGRMSDRQLWHLLNYVRSLARTDDRRSGESER
jgi:mono/diheme cytochrome c family protein